MKWEAHYDAYSRAVFKAFEDKLKPLMAQAAPDWLLHHMEIRRNTRHDFEGEVEIRLVIRPIGSAKFRDTDADLLTGYKRIGQ